MWRLVLYSKRNCPLCEEAKAALQEFAKECDLSLEVVDISKDPVLWEQYQFEIPILFMDGQELVRHHIGLKKLRVLHKRWTEGKGISSSHARDRRAHQPAHLAGTQRLAFPGRFPLRVLLGVAARGSRRSAAASTSPSRRATHSPPIRSV